MSLSAFLVNKDVELYSFYGFLFFGHNLRTRMNSVGGHYSVSTFQHRVTEYPEECTLLRYVSSGCGNDGKACNTTYVNICTSSAEK